MSGKGYIKNRSKTRVRARRSFLLPKRGNREEGEGARLNRDTTNEPVTTCCSDALTRTTGMNAELRLQCLRNLTDLLSRTFKGLFVFPVLGHDDTVNFSQLAELWSTWLPQEALDTLKSGTYDLHSLHPCPPPSGNGFSLSLSLVIATSNIDRARSLNFPPLGTILIHSLMNLCCLWI